MESHEPTGAEPHVVFEHVSLAFGERTVLRDFSCTFPRGRISVILGGSGAGKTTLLRLVGGLIRPQSGKIMVAGEDITQFSEAEMERVRANLGMMFQGGALLNSMPIFENLAFPLREHTKLSETEIAKEVERTLNAVGLVGVEELLPGELSGGMIKRAALARAILMRPEILLCDEPFSGLDPISVKRIEAVLRRLNMQLGITMLVSSHHIPSTLRMADQVVLLWEQGAIIGTPEAMRSHVDAHVAEFFNEAVTEEVAQAPRRAARRRAL
jgi:phospholipid/cholesterol/gamma-HCH transport system ATP-binding protein